MKTVSFILLSRNILEKKYFYYITFTKMSQWKLRETEREKAEIQHQTVTYIYATKTLGMWTLENVTEEFPWGHKSNN